MIENRGNSVRSKHCPVTLCLFGVLLVVWMSGCGQTEETDERSQLRDTIIVRCVASPDGQTVAFSNGDGSLGMWQQTSGDIQWRSVEFRIEYGLALLSTASRVALSGKTSSERDRAVATKFFHLDDLEFSHSVDFPKGVWVDCLSEKWLAAQRAPDGLFAGKETTSLKGVEFWQNNGNGGYSREFEFRHAKNESISLIRQIDDRLVLMHVKSLSGVPDKMPTCEFIVLNLESQKIIHRCTTDIANPLGSCSISESGRHFVASTWELIEVRSLPDLTLSYRHGNRSQVGQ